MRNAILLFLIVLLALGLRIFCYTGPIGSDDNSYYIGAYEIHEGTYQPTSNYWKTRYGMLLPIAASYKVFGTNEYAAALWPMLSALGAVIVCYFLGKSVLDEKTGLLAALLLAVYPLDIHYSGLILPDVPLSFLMAASALAFIHASRSDKHAPIFYLISGLLLAFAYSCRSMAILLVPFLGVYVAFFERKLKRSHALFALGFLAPIFLEGFYFWTQGLSPWHNFNLNARATVLVNSSGECSTSQAYYPTVMFNSLPIFGPHFFLFIPAMVYSLVKRERGALIFLCWAGIILFVLQFGFVSLFPPLPIIKVRKFLILATVPLILIGAWALMQLRGRFRWALAAVLLGTSLYSIEPYSYKDDRTPETVGGQTERVLAYLEKLPPKPIYASRRTNGMLRISSGFEIKPERLHDLNKVKSPHDLENCYVVINRFYILFDSTNPYGNLPYFLRDYPTGIPDSWKWKQFLQAVVFDVPPARPRP